MNNDNEFYVILVVLICFVGGYFLISFIVNKIKVSNASKQTGNKKQEWSGREENKSNSTRFEKESQQDNSTHDTNNKNSGYRSSNLDIEQRYFEILDLVSGASKEEVKKSYRNLIAKYHPDKVNHLGLEFQKIAADKTRKINEAYSYFKQKYNII
jgi:hypothetical protein